MSVSRVDQLYRKLLLTKFFTKGWGKPDNLKRLFAFRKILSNREKCQHLVSADYPIHIDKEYRDGGYRILEGHFTSPFVHHMPGIMPSEVEKASFQMILPVKWRNPHLKPVCIHLAGTGDHFFWRRRLLTARPLLKESGIASIILENPYYGTRKPKEQLRSSLHNVSDLFVMGGALVLESMALLHWCEREGWGPLGLSGISMGGHMVSGVATLWPKPISVVPILSWTTASIIFTEMASLAATNWTKPVTLVPCLSWSTASCVFTQGVMSGAIPWETLQEQFFENSIYQDEIKHLIVSPEDNAYSMGQQFVKDYSANVEEMQTAPEKKQNYKFEPSLSAFEHHARKMRNGNLSIGTVASSTERLQDEIHSSVRTSQLSNDQKHVTTKGVGMPVTLTIPPEDSQIDKLNSEVKETILSTKQVSVESAGQQLASNLSAEPTSHLSKSSQTETSPKAKRRMQVMNPSELSLNYAKTKELQQQSKTVSSSQQQPLPLRHAVAKTGLMVGRERGKHGKLHGLREEAFNFMRGVMDECTHLGNFSIPVDPELIIIVSARQDAYVPRDGVLPLDQLWPGCEVRYIDQGHVGAVVLHQKIFRKAITDAFERQISKYHRSSGDHHLTAS
ncbi:protein abhd18 [Plakobranchus ocellatus]|uniref:Protein abhd18 n=1 Tax=Plakobranchus ocellatus TaxID=259542 RepID=A0AAV3ZGF0_9GAST|nr:protein abhd18 [Plakobranchus ocellatus]